MSEQPQPIARASDLHALVDATGGDFYSQGSDLVQRVVVFSKVKPSGEPYFTNDDRFLADARALRVHRLKRPTPDGSDDQRWSFQVVNDKDAEYGPPEAGMAPYGQPEEFTALNRSTREVDGQGRVALPRSQRWVVDSEDGRHVIALAMQPLELGESTSPETPTGLDTQAGSGPQLPPGVSIGERNGTPSVSIGGTGGAVTFFGSSAVQAALDAAAAGGTTQDVARWASAAARGSKRPPLEGQASSVATQERVPPPVEPTRARGGAIVASGRPTGYVTDGEAHGLLATFFTTQGTDEVYFRGAEGTPIRRLGARHDGHFSMEVLTGRIYFSTNDASTAHRGAKPYVGEMWHDPSRANIDTSVGQETGQWRPVVPVDADLPPAIGKRIPTGDTIPGDGGGGGRTATPGGGGGGPGGGPPPAGGGPPPAGGGPPGPGGDGANPFSGPNVGVVPGSSSGTASSPSSSTAGTTTTATTKGDGGAFGGDDGIGVIAPPLTLNPASQARDYSPDASVPCINSTAGRLTQAVPAPGIVLSPDGAARDTHGYPAVTYLPGGALALGGHEAKDPEGRDLGGLGPLGPLSFGVGDGVDAGINLLPPGAQPGGVELGLPVDPNAPGIHFLPPKGGDKGVLPRPNSESDVSSDLKKREEQREARVKRTEDKTRAREDARIKELKRLDDEAKARYAKAMEEGRRRDAQLAKREAEKTQRDRQAAEKKAADRREKAEKKEQRERERAKKTSEQIERVRNGRKDKDGKTVLDRTRERLAKAKEAKDQGLIGHLGGPSNGASSAEGAYVVPSLAMATAVGVLGKDPAASGPGGRFGEYNAANFQVPAFGSPGGAASLQDHVAMVTTGLNALQAVVGAVFAGPRTYGGNMALVERNRPDKEVVGSDIGQEVTALPGQTVTLAGGQGKTVRITSTLNAPSGATIVRQSGAVLAIQRLRKGGGSVIDHAPLLQLSQDTKATGDLFSDDQRRAFTTYQAQVTGAALRAHVFAGDPLQALEVAQVNPDSRQVVETFLGVDREDGTAQLSRGLEIDNTDTDPIPTDSQGFSFLNGVPQLSVNGIRQPLVGAGSATAAGFGGDGSLGDVVYSGHQDLVAASSPYMFNNLTINAGVVVAPTGGAAAAGGIAILVRGNLVVNGALCADGRGLFVAAGTTLGGSGGTGNIGSTTGAGNGVASSDSYGGGAVMAGGGGGGGGSGGAAGGAPASSEAGGAGGVGQNRGGSVDAIGGGASGPGGGARAGSQNGLAGTAGGAPTALAAGYRDAYEVAFRFVSTPHLFPGGRSGSGGGGSGGSSTAGGNGIGGTGGVSGAVTAGGLGTGGNGGNGSSLTASGGGGGGGAAGAPGGRIYIEVLGSVTIGASGRISARGGGGGTGGTGGNGTGGTGAGGGGGGGGAGGPGGVVILRYAGTLTNAGAIDANAGAGGGGGPGGSGSGATGGAGAAGNAGEAGIVLTIKESGAA